MRYIPTWDIMSLVLQFIFTITLTTTVTMTITVKRIFWVPDTKKMASRNIIFWYWTSGDIKAFLHHRPKIMPWSKRTRQIRSPSTIHQTPTFWTKGMLFGKISNFNFWAQYNFGFQDNYSDVVSPITVLRIFNMEKNGFIYYINTS